MALDVDERLLGDAPHLPLLQDGQPLLSVEEQLEVDVGPLAHPGGELLEDGRQVGGGRVVVDGQAHQAAQPFTRIRSAVKYGARSSAGTRSSATVSAIEA